MANSRTRAAVGLIPLLLCSCGDSGQRAELDGRAEEVRELRQELAESRRALNEERARADEAVARQFAESTRVAELEERLAAGPRSEPSTPEGGPAGPVGAVDSGRDAELVRLHLELATEREDAARLEAELLTHMEALLVAREREAEGEAELGHLSVELSEERALRAAAERDLERLREESEAARLHEAALREETVSLTVDVTRLERLVGELRAERDAARVDVEELAASLASGDPAGEEALERLRGDLAAARNALSLAEAELARSDEQRAQRSADVAQLQRELAEERAKRFEREEQWLDYARFVDAADLRALLVQGGFPLAVDALAAEDAPEPEPDERRLRGEELLSELRALLAAEEVRGLDLLELGRVGEGWTGPAVFRLLDDRGRLTGGLYAEQLSLEASQAGRTVTFVLARGYESRGGKRHEFEDGVRRVVAREVDPSSWIEAAPELFPPGAVEDLGPRDDGRHDLVTLRAELNLRLSRDGAGSTLWLRRFGGVVDGVLRDVHLVDRDGAGRLLRDLLADRLTLVRHEGGVELLLEDGVSIRDGRKAAFLDGRMRILLPRADPTEWSAAGLPFAVRADSFGPAGGTAPGHEGGPAGSAIDATSGAERSAEAGGR